KISFAPTDSGYSYCQINIENDVCPNQIYWARGGWPGKRAIIQTIKLDHPNGGQVFLAGSDTVITWEGVTPQEKVKLEYSIDSGKRWIFITDTASGLSYKWHVPNTPSNLCLARVTAKAEYDDCGVKIGNQIWMCKNLDVDHYRNGKPIRHAVTNAEWVDAGNKQEGAWCYYNNSDSLGAIYGKHYNWYAVIDTIDGLAPNGWHVPSDSEWTTMENYLIANGYNYDGTTTGNKIAKSLAAASGWESCSLIGTIGNTDYSSKRNVTNFSALPCGEREYYGLFDGIGHGGIWWSSTECSTICAWIRESNCCAVDLIRGNCVYDKSIGFPVRCLHD
ncbi:MAG: fibrobacter succinogenes major paralogous domain-containing protein, partial [Candidatus Kapabacteria bacterium]|nr:fibrobacter succinogenes major paralogous domain-containing protein [Candidatus Kapabacteria bacterium]